MSIILGIDPGSRITGYGLIEAQGFHLKHIDCGIIQTNPKLSFHERLYQIFLSLQKIIETYQPSEATIEQIFNAKNVASSFKLGHARGAAITAIASHHIPITEYTPRAIKLAVTGYGAAEKHQIQQMIAKILKLPEPPYEDAADALAIAICHAHSKKNTLRFT